MVADGVGVGGAEASATALTLLKRYVDGSVTVYYGARANESEFPELLQSAAMQAHNEVLEISKSESERTAMCASSKRS